MNQIVLNEIREYRRALLHRREVDIGLAAVCLTPKKAFDLFHEVYNDDTLREALPFGRDMDYAALKGTEVSFLKEHLVRVFGVRVFVDEAEPQEGLRCCCCCCRRKCV